MASSISGFVYSDANANGVREVKEKGIAKIRVYLDTNQDGAWQTTEPSQLTSKTGAYDFEGLAAGDYKVRTVATKGMRRSSPLIGYFDINANGNDIHVANDFGLTTLAMIRGSIFNDLNHDGVQQNTETGIPGVVVYIDKNNNGKWDTAKELATMTDIYGTYRFNGLKAGSYTVRVVPPTAGTTVTMPANDYFKAKVKKAQVLSNVKFGLI